MSEHYDNRSPEEIQRDIERTRAEMGATIETIRQKMSPGELLDQAIDYFKHSGPSQFTSNLGETVKNNPVPVTLIGLGIGWLMVAGSRDNHPSRTGATASHARDSVGVAASGAVDKAGQMVQGAREHTGAARERMGEMAHSAQERMGEASARLGEVAQSMRYQVRSQSAQVRDTFTYLRDEQPLILGVLGFALGAALGAGLPPTRQEDELMGEMRDEAMHRAREVGAEQLDKVKHVASAATEAATEQADKEGISRQSVDQRPREAVDSRDRMAPVGSHAAKEEACKPDASP
jgi:hypothetical protein